MDERGQRGGQYRNVIIGEPKLFETMAMKKWSRQISDLIAIESEDLQRSFMVKNFSWNVT